MLRLILSALALCLTTGTTVEAQSYAIRDREGRTTGYVVPQLGGGAAIRDRAGRTTGYVVPRPGGGADIRGRDGRRIGTVVELPSTRRDPRADLSRPDWWRPSR